MNPQALPLEQLIVRREADDIEIVPVQEGADAFGAYYADACKTMDREPGMYMYRGPSHADQPTSV
jgi:hypothetical protein